MNRWLGSVFDAERQAAERAQRAARRTIAKLTDIIDSESDDDFRDCDLSTSFLNLDGQGDEDTASVSSTGSAVVPVVMAAFETENGTDDDEYYKKLSTLKNRIFNKAEVEFWFTSFEASLKHIGIKRLRVAR